MTTRHQHDHAHTQRPPISPIRPTPTSNLPISPKTTVTEDAIRARAYQLWEAAGRPVGEDVTYWLEAEQELTRR